jgi:hypothetical protein
MRVISTPATPPRVVQPPVTPKSNKKLNTDILSTPKSSVITPKTTPRLSVAPERSTPKSAPRLSRSRNPSGQSLLTDDVVMSLWGDDDEMDMEMITDDGELADEEVRAKTRYIRVF